jgi:hypothetical protein
MGKSAKHIGLILLTADEIARTRVSVYADFIHIF